MVVHQIAFRLNDSIPYEAEILRILNEEYPHESAHKAAENIVKVYAKQGLTHPGVNPLAAQTFYQTPDNTYQQPVINIAEPTIQSLGIENPETQVVDIAEPIIPTSGMGTIEIDFDAL